MSYIVRDNISIGCCLLWQLIDVTDDISVKNAIQSITSESSRIDVLVNNAGYGLTGAFEDLSMEEIKAQYETNLFGVIREDNVHNVGHRSTQ